MSKRKTAKPAADSRQNTTPVAQTSAPQVPQKKALLPELQAFGNHPALNSDVRVYQIFYRQDQLAQLEPEFIPYNNAGGDFALLEYHVFRKLYESGINTDCKYWGALSWRFREKALIGANELFAIMNANPGFDLYFMNPEPHIEGLYENLWVQGSTAHPNFMSLMEQVFDSIGMDRRILSAVRHTRTMAAANYFVGSQRFWAAYMAFIDDFMLKVQQKCPPALYNTLKNTNADPRDLHSNANYFPFMIERLLTEFIVNHIGQLSCFKIELGGKRARMQVHGPDLEWLKNQALERRDEKMLSVWRNYRNLYFRTLYGTTAQG